MDDLDGNRNSYIYPLLRASENSYLDSPHHERHKTSLEAGSRSVSADSQPALTNTGVAPWSILSEVRL